MENYKKINQPSDLTTQEPTSKNVKKPFVFTMNRGLGYVMYCLKISENRLKMNSKSIEKSLEKLISFLIDFLSFFCRFLVHFDVQNRCKID